MTTPTDQRAGSRAALSIVALAAVYVLGLGIVAAAVIAAGGKGGSDGSASGGSDSTKIEVKLSEFKIDGNLTAPAGNVVLALDNVGSVEHNVKLEGGKASTMLAPGKSENLDLGKLEPGTYTLLCEVPGHEAAGMKATLTITEAGASGGSDSGDSAGGDHSSGSGEPDYKQMDADMLASFAAFPAKTEGRGNQLLEPKVMPDGVKQFELTAKIADWEVEPGKVVKAWTYNGMVPAPMIKVDVGDRIRVLFRNELPVNQDIHWHGIEVPFAMDGVAPITQEPVLPGGDFTYEFTLDKPYQGMYHPHLHGQMTLPNGMFGVIQAGPTPVVSNRTISGVQVPGNVAPTVDMPMVLNDAGVIGYSLNGKSFPATDPIVVKEGDWVSLTYYNEGLQVHPMHLHQFPQLVVAKDGIPLDNPYWVDTLLVAPGERYTVQFHAVHKGTWVFHCHILNHAERETGMFGMVTAVVVE